MTGASGAVTLAAEPSEAAATYRPHLDGLRAVAVYLVLLFHAGLGRFSGGYIGVDVFFVLSGFLVTQLLLRDLARSGSIRFGRFYSRRFRRLLPAAFVTLIVTAVVFTAIASPDEVANAVGSFKAAFLYSANWYFIHQSHAYFTADIASDPVLHFWSLAVEEQFYLLWPLALGGLYAVTRRVDPRRQVRAIQVVVGAGALASAIWALSIRTSDPIGAYYGTGTRAYELLAGATIALVPALAARAARATRAMRYVTLASMAAVLALATSLIHLDAIERGIAVTVATCVLIVAIDAAAGGIVKRVLSSPPVVYLGKISYGTYLWHLLVILVAVRTFAISPIATAGVACLLATGVAALSFEILEHPVRTSRLLDRHRGLVIAAGLIISVTSALVFIPRIVDPAHASRPSAGGVDSTNLILTPVPSNLDLLGVKQDKADVPFTNCLDKLVARCTIVHGTGRHVLLIGDSHAWMLIPAFTEIARREHLTLSVTVFGGCPWQRGLYSSFNKKECSRIKEDLYKRVLADLHPDLVVAANIGDGTAGPYPHLIGTNGAQRVSASEFARATNDSIDELRADGRDVLLVDPVPLPLAPSPAFDPFHCLRRAKVLEECRYRAYTSPAVVAPYRGMSEDAHVQILNLDRSVCPALPICDPIVDGRIVKFDPSHLTAAFARTLAPGIAADLKDVGFLPR